MENLYKSLKIKKLLVKILLKSFKWWKEHFKVNFLTLQFQKKYINKIIFFKVTNKFNK
jgi:hypothetical protein